MPYRIRKVRNKDCYSVKNLKTNKLSSKCTTRKKANKQIRLLYSLDYNQQRQLYKTSKNRKTRKTRTTRK